MKILLRIVFWSFMLWVVQKNNCESRLRSVSENAWNSWESLSEIHDSCNVTYLASRASANTPAASGAAAEVPEWVRVHFPYKSVVAWTKQILSK